jgi:hypothetical protein
VAGTLIAYQGHRCQSVTFNRSRGYAPSISSVVVPVKSFPEGFNFDLPPQTGVANLPNLEIPDLSAIRTGRMVPTDLSRDLRWAGTLVMAEHQDSTWRVVVHPMFVVGIEMQKSSEEVPEARPLQQLVRISLADARLLWGSRGFIRRWSYNRARGDGSLAKDSGGAAGGAIQRVTVARDVVGALPGSPDLSDSPAEWTNDRRQVDFPPFSQAVLALGVLVREASLADPCLRLDNTVALHRKGDGRLGWASEGQGRNTRDFPGPLKLWKEFGSPGYSIEPTYRDEFVLVRGGRRIQTVQVDNAEPVLYANGIVRVLDDELVGELTGGAWKLATLRKWVLRSRAKQGQSDIKPEVLRLFREQAFRLWRVAGVEVEKPFEQEIRSLGLVLERTDTIAAPGPNAHLLAGPGMLPRAETSAGKRWPVTVEAFTFRGVRTKLLGISPASDQEAQARQRLAEIQQRITTALAGDQGLFGSAEFGAAPFAGPGSRSVWNRTKDLLLGGDRDGAIPSEVLTGTGSASWADLGAKEDLVQLVERLSSVDPGLAKQYEQELVRMFKSRDAQHGTVEADLYDLAKKARGLQLSLAKLDLGGTRAGEGFLGTIERAREFGGNLRAVADEELRRIFEELQRIGEKQDRQQSQEGTRERGAAQAARRSKIQYRNEERTEVTASVFSARLGIVKTSKLVGHLEDEGVSDPTSSRLRIMPVRITFGSQIRPRLDVSPSGGGTTTTRVRQQSEDQLSWFSRAFRRGPDGQPVGIASNEIPDGEGHVIVRDDMVELLPLEVAPQEPTEEQQAERPGGTAQALGLAGGFLGDGPNGPALEEFAKELAADRFSAPAKIESATYVMARPFPVNCDGLVSAITIQSRSDPLPGTGFETRISVGRIPQQAPGLGTTRERRRPPAPRGERDAPNREGLQ